MLDPRVAHGIAKRTVAAVEDIGYVTGGGLDTLVMTRLLRRDISVLPQTDKGARRKIDEALKLIAPSAIAHEVGESKKDGPFIQWIGLDAINPDKMTLGERPHEGFPHSIALAWFRFYPRADAFVRHFKDARSLALYPLHSIARHHQRAGGTDWKSVRDAIVATIPDVWLMLETFGLANLRQVFASTGAGLFVGEPVTVPEHAGYLFFKTFLSEQTLSRKWQDCNELLRAAHLEMAAGHALRLLTSQGSDAVAGVVVAHAQQLYQSPRFDWLRRPYEEGVDRDAQAWDQHRLSNQGK